MSFFELRTPHDMLEKARREHRRLMEHFDIDNAFNFFVTVNHIRDYVRGSGAVTQVVLEAFLQDEDIKDSRDLCDKGKHLALTKRANPETHIWSGCIGGAPIGILSINGSDKWILLSGTREVDVRSLSERALEKWEEFFLRNGL